MEFLNPKSRQQQLWDSLKVLLLTEEFSRSKAKKHWAGAITRQVVREGLWNWREIVKESGWRGGMETDVGVNLLLGIWRWALCEREDSQWGRWNPVLVRRLQWKVGRQTRIKRGAFIRVMQEVGRMAGIESNGEMRFPKAKQVGLIVEYCEV